MSGLSLYVGFWDGATSSVEVLDRVCAHLERVGASVMRTNPWGASVRNFGPFVDDGETAGIHIIDPDRTSDGLIQLVTSIDEINDSPRARWRPFLQQILDLVQEVSPALAVVTVDWPVDELPNPDWDAAKMMLDTGWVNPNKLNSTQRVAFDNLVRRGLASRIGQGIWWSTWDDLNPAEEPMVHPRRLFLADVYRAWTGRQSPEELDWDEPDRLTAEEMAPRQLWFWSADIPAERLCSRVQDAVSPFDLTARVADYGLSDPWPIVVAQFEPTGRSVEKLLDDLRAVLGEIGPSWAGVQPQSGVVMPGPDWIEPATSVVTHPWVSNSWIGKDRPRLEATLAGCHREIVADGVLWVTDPDLMPDSRFAETWYDSRERFERLSAAADILGQAARRSLGMER
jgi:hypothetical protein